MYRRHRLGHRAQLHRLRPARQRRDRRDVRRRPEPAARGPLLGDHREVPGHHLLHRADGDPRLHQVGRPVAEQARPVEPAAARHRRRADQSRSVDVVSRGHRRGTLPDRRYLVADRNRRDHDRAAARRDRRPSPAVATRPLPGVVAEIVDKQGKPVPAESGRLPRHQASRGRRCCARSTATTSATSSSTGRRSRASTSPPTARAGTRTATSGSWAASTTC